MKKIIIPCVVMLASVFANAEIPKKFNVYTSGAGAATAYCRELVNEYNKKYQSQVLLVIKPGAGGLLATLDMVNDTNFSFYCFAASSEMFLNRIQYPGYEKEHDALTPVAVIAEAPIIFNTRISSPFTTLTDLIDSKKPLTVGYHTTTALILSNKIFNPNTTTFVNHKTAQDAIVSVADGSIDVYIDGGTFSGKAYTSMFKSLGYMYGPNSTPGVNLTAKFKHKNIAKSAAVVLTTKNTKITDIEELNQRLNIVLKEPVLTNIIVNLNNAPVFLNLQETTTLVVSIKAGLSK